MNDFGFFRNKNETEQNSSRTARFRDVRALPSPAPDGQGHSVMISKCPGHAGDTSPRPDLRVREASQEPAFGVRVVHGLLVALGLDASQWNQVQTPRNFFCDRNPTEVTTFDADGSTCSPSPGPGVRWPTSTAFSCHSPPMFIKA